MNWIAICTRQRPPRRHVRQPGTDHTYCGRAIAGVRLATSLTPPHQRCQRCIEAAAAAARQRSLW